MKKKITKQILLWSLVGLSALSALAGVYCVLRFGFSIDVLDRTDWSTKNGTVRYLDYFGRPQTGWQEIEGNRYYFAPEDGAMVVGWYQIDDSRYHFGADGVCNTEWLQKDGKQYYLGDDGALTTGWQTLDGKTYYFAPDDGAMATGWLNLEGDLFYLAQDGTTVSGWVELEGIRYRFADDGSAVTGWYEDDSGKYFFDEDGKPHSGWLEWEQKKYYLKDDGSVITGWLELDSDRYYFLPTGRMAIGEVEIDGVTTFFTSTGKPVLLCNPWHAIPEDFELDLVILDGKKVASVAKEPLEQMIQGAAEDGVRITINNIYRSHYVQEVLWYNRTMQWMEEGLTKEEAELKTGESVAIPGHSEHETGLALDVNSGANVYEWLGENCWDYGFILRYPADRIEITGIIYEPWHFRYVGTELSLELKELGLCMEEYMTMLTEQQKNIPD